MVDVLIALHADQLNSETAVPVGLIPVDSRAARTPKRKPKKGLTATHRNPFSVKIPRAARSTATKAMGHLHKRSTQRRRLRGCERPANGRLMR